MIIYVSTLKPSHGSFITRSFRAASATNYQVKKAICTVWERSLSFPTLSSPHTHMQKENAHKHLEHYAKAPAAGNTSPTGWQEGEGAERWWCGIVERRMNRMDRWERQSAQQAQWHEGELCSDLLCFHIWCIFHYFTILGWFLTGVLQTWWSLKVFQPLLSTFFFFLNKGLFLCAHFKKSFHFFTLACFVPILASSPEIYLLHLFKSGTFSFFILNSVVKIDIYKNS